MSSSDGTLAAKIKAQECYSSGDGGTGPLQASLLAQTADRGGAANKGLFYATLSSSGGPRVEASLPRALGPWPGAAGRASLRGRRVPGPEPLKGWPRFSHGSCRALMTAEGRPLRRASGAALGRAAP